MEQVSHVTLGPADTVNLQVALTSVPRLKPVRVTANADLEYHNINAAEIAKANVPLLDAYDIILRLRPLSLGNPYKGCMTDTSTFTFGPPRIDTTDTVAKKVREMQKKMQDPRKFTLGVGNWLFGLFKNGGGQISKKGPGSTFANDGIPPVNSAYPFHLYINGILRDGPPGAKNILSQIPVDDIDEMRYIDCLDTTTPQYRNSLMIILKPGKVY